MKNQILLKGGKKILYQCNQCQFFNFNSIQFFLNKLNFRFIKRQKKYVVKKQCNKINVKKNSKKLLDQWKYYQLIRISVREHNKYFRKIKQQKLILNMFWQKQQKL